MADMGRPEIPIDFAQLKALMRMKPTAEDCAAFFKCSVATIERRILANTVSDEFPEGLTFAEFRDQNMVHTRFSIIRSILKKADQGDNIMLIYASKNLCGWNDGKTQDIKVEVNNSVLKTDADVESRLIELYAKRAAEKCGPDMPEIPDAPAETIVIDGKDAP